MDNKRTEWTDAAGWLHFEVCDKDGNLVESGRRSPSGTYDEKRLHVDIPRSAFEDIYKSRRDA